MRRLVGVLAIAIVVMGIVSGFLFYQLSVMQSLNSDLRSQNAEIQNQTNQIENQITDLQNQNSELQNLITELEDQLSKVTNLVKITRFTTSGFSPIGGMLIESIANVTVQNFGINDVNGLTLSIKYYDVETLLEPLQLDNLSAGEERIINTHIRWILTDNTGEPFTATLWLGNQVLDEYILD